MDSFSMLGMKIVVNPLCRTPKMKLRENVPVTLEFRAEIDAWMEEFFGVEENIFVDHGHNTMHVSQQYFDTMRKHAMHVAQEFTYGL